MTTTVPRGTVIGSYTVEALIGRGGMGEVYRAADREHGYPVALKLLHPMLAAQEEFAARFVREARVMQSLEHSGIVPVFDAGEADGRLYLSMRLIHGISLKELLTQGQPSTEETLRLLTGLADALDYAHSRGVIHRDHSFVDTVGREKDPAKVEVRFLPGRLELAALVPQTNAGTDLNLANGVTAYVGDIELSTTPGSDGNFCWGLRWAVQGKLAYELCIDTEAEFIQLVVWNGQNKAPITPRIPLPGLQTGRVVALTVVVRESQLTLFVDGQQVADVEDHQVPPSQTIPGLDVYSKERGATVNIHALSLYALVP
jgi:hypothetical protein